MYRMYFKIFLFLLLFVDVMSYYTISRNKYRMILTKCNAENPTVKTNEIRRARRGYFSSRPEFQKFTYCTLHAAGLIHENGNGNEKALEEVLRAQNTPNDVIIQSKAAVNQCNTQTSSSDRYFQAWSVTKCLYHALPKSITL